MRVRHTFALAVLAAILTAACINSSASPAPPAAAAAQRPVQEPPAAVCRPLLLALQKDRTGSARETATPDITQEHLAGFIDLVRRCGGEIAAGDICADSFNALTRLRIEEPPVPPVEPAWSSNPFEHQQQLAAYLPLLQGYQRTAAAYATSTEVSVAAFAEAAWPRLSAAPSCRASDVAGSVSRSLLFLEEIGGGWSVEPRRVIGLIGDGRHNTGKWDVTVPEDIDVLLVNGIGSRGAFPDAPNVHLFESIAGATRYLRPVE